MYGKTYKSVNSTSLTTPEKWDSITRRWKEGGIQSLMSQVELLLIDEGLYLIKGVINMYLSPPAK